MTGRTSGSTNAFAMMWGGVLVAVLYYFGRVMYDFASSAALLMEWYDPGSRATYESQESFLQSFRHLHGWLVASGSIPTSMFFWMIIFMLAPTKQIKDLRVLVVMLVSLITLTHVFMTHLGYGYNTAMYYGGISGSPFVFGFNTLVSCAIVLAGVYFVPKPARFLARSLVVCFAPDHIREHYKGLLEDDGQSDPGAGTTD